MKTLDVYNQVGKKVDSLDIDSKVFDGKVNSTLIHQVVVAFLASNRQGTAVAKNKSMVRGGGRKPWRQKGTGRARVGSNRSPLWRGGGVTFGPSMRNYRKRINKKKKVRALKDVLNSKIRDNAIFLIDKIQLKDYKTKNLATLLKKIKVDSKKTKLIIDNTDDNLKKAARNIKLFSWTTAVNLNAYQVLDCEQIILTVDSFKKIQDRIGKCLN
jgi:large subunit ribosomal protein L4